MKDNGILMDVEERKALIDERGSEILPHPLRGNCHPPELLAEVANLVESPMPFLGSFDEEFLALPKDVLVMVMKKHQRYFPIEYQIS